MELEVRGLGRRFEDGRWGLRDVNFRIGSGEFVLLTGHNGSGKSLLIRHFFGLETPTEGTLRLDGQLLAGGCLPLRRKSALVFQQPEHQILGLTVREDLEFTLKGRGIKGPDLVIQGDKALEEVGLEGFGNRLCAFLSGGEKRRLAIASALMSQPDLLVLDEPFNGLDWPGVRILLEILQGLHRRGLAILLVTHDLEKCLGLTDRLAVMAAGRMILDGPPGDLWHQLGSAGLRIPPLPAGDWRSLSWLN